MLTVAAFLSAPRGRGKFTPEYFPGAPDGGEAVARERLRAGYLYTSALTDPAAQDAAVGHYFDWQTYEALWLALLAVPASTTVAQNDVSVSWTDEQRREIGRLALAAKAALDDDLAEEAELAAEPDPMPFGAVPKDAVWE